MPQGKLIVVAGPSGVGKRTLISHVLANVPDCWFSVSATTRSPRPGDVNGKDYHFISHTEFHRRIHDEEFLEWAKFAGENFYGTPRHAVIERLERGTTVLAELEVQGAKQVKEKIPGAATVFVHPPEPALAVLHARIVGRGDVSPESLERRLRTAQEELAQQDFFEHHIINDDLGLAMNEILWLVRRLIKTSVAA